MSDNLSYTVQEAAKAIGVSKATIWRRVKAGEFQAFTWCRDEASGIARAWREGREFGHNVAAVWAEAI